MAAVYPSDVFRRPGCLAAGAAGLTRSRSLGRYAWTIRRAARKVARLSLDRLASYRQAALAAYAQARPLFERALAISREGARPRASRTAASLNNSAVTASGPGRPRGRAPSTSARWRSARGRSAPSIPIPRKPQQPRASASGPGRPSGRGRLRARAGDPREGVGPEHPDTAVSLNNLAVLLQAQERLWGRAAL